jgi:CubicO group peptidase (beta-lactamase class C family)
VIRRTFLVAALVALAPAGARADPPPGPAPAPAPAAARRDAAPLLAPAREKHDLPALAGVVVLGDGRVTAAGVVGVRRRGSPEAATLADRWHLGSCTKSMTATLCALLVEEKRLSWDATVGGVFAKAVPAIDPSWKPVTLDLLLHHRAGAPADLRADGLWDRLWRFRGTPKDARLALVAGVVAKPPVSPPGTKYLYSNAGFATAGAMAETVTGRGWEQLLRERLFAPLGITTAGFGAPGTAARVDQPRGHGADGKPVEPGLLADNPVAIGPAGTVHMTIEDWARYVAAHVSGERSGRLLPSAAWKRLHAPPDGEGTRYAMGWVVTDRDWGGEVLTHNGSNTMWYCVAWLSPSKDFAVLVTCNRGGPQAEQGCDQAAWALIQDHLAHEGKAN